MSTVKTLKYSIAAFAHALLSAGCTEELTYTPGEAENPDSYGVYFPTQSTATELDLLPSEETEATYKIRRTKTTDAILVPVVVETSEEGIFEIDPIVFGPDEAETEFTIHFDKAEQGVQYTCNIRIEDPDYIEIYGKRSTTLSISVIRADWKLVTGPNGETTGKWRDNIISNMYSLNISTYNPYPEIDVEIYEREDRPGYYRMKVYGDALMNALAGGNNTVSYTGRDVWTTVDATDPEKVYLPYQSTGVTLVSEDGELRFGSSVEENFSMDATANQYGTLEDGMITFPAQSVMLELANNSGSFYYGNREGMLRIMLPGTVEKDYSVTLTKDAPEEGRVKITTVLGDDVSAFRYSILSGTLDDNGANLQAQNLDSAKDFDGSIIMSETGSIYVINVTGLETGKYTLVGCIYDEENVMRNYAFIPFGYIAQGDERPVMLTFGLEFTKEFEGQGISSDNSVKFYAYGEGIESLTYGLFRSNRLSGMDLESVLDNNGTNFTSAELEDLNNGHFSVLLKDLNGDSDYTLVVRASNGYVSKTSTATVKTTGTFDPGKEVFYYEDFLPNSQEPTLEKLVSTKWNYYAFNFVDDNPVRRRIGTVEITENEELSENHVTLLDIKGLGGIEFESGGTLIGAYMPGSTMFTGYNGAIALSVGEITGNIYNGNEVTIGFINSNDLYVYYSQTYYMFFGAVADGYLYAVRSPVYEEEGYLFDFLFMGSQSELYGLFGEMMLVDPEKDLGTMPSAAIERIGAIRRQALRGFTPGNYVELPEYSMAPGSGSDREIPVVNLAVDPIPASAPSARRVDAEMTAVPFSMSTASGSGEIVKTGVQKRTM